MIKLLELFGGIGACSAALERLGIDYEIADYVEIDKYAVKSYNAMHGTNFEPQDITKWDKDIEVDLIMHGSPCQDFSVAGKGAGGDEGSGTRSSLMYETLRIVEKLKPKYVVWENVKNLLSKKHKHNFESYIYAMDRLGYYNFYEVLNAKDYGIPQNRERVFTISIRRDICDTVFEFPTKQELKLKLKDMLEDEVDEKYYLSGKMINYICARMPKGEHHITTGIHMHNKDSQESAGTICTEPGNKPSDNYVIENENIEYSKEEGYLRLKNNTKKCYLEARALMRGPYKTENLESAEVEIDGRSLQEKVCDRAIEENFVEPNDVIDYSYANSRMQEMDKGFIQTKNSKDNSIMNTLRSGTNQLGVTVEDNRNLKEKLCDTLIQQGKVKENDVIRHSYSTCRMKQWEERNIETNNETPTLDTRCDCLGVCVASRGRYNKKGEIEQHLEERKDGCTNTITSVQKDNMLKTNLRIRKLTPKECWRLMGFKDEEFEKAKKVNSNSQLYKQAGNSIVVNVLVEVLKKLLEEKEHV